MSLPYPEPGVRLIRQDRVEEFAAQMADFQVELDDAVRQPRPPLRRAEAGRRRAARAPVQPGRLSRDAGRPLRRRSGTSPAFEPPDYLRAALPGLYEQERARVAARFDEAVQLAEQAFLEEFARLVAHLSRADHRRRRGRPAAGLPRLGRGQPVGVLRPVPRAERPLERAARRAGRAGPAGGAGRGRPGPARQRGRCASGWRRQLAQVQSALDAMLVERPRRRILRQAAAPGEA